MKNAEYVELKAKVLTHIENGKPLKGKGEVELVAPRLTEKQYYEMNNLIHEAVKRMWGLY